MTVWTSVLSCGHPMLDDDHREIIGIIGGLDARTLRERPESFRALQARLEDHFRREETEMARLGYPRMREHQAEHRQLLEQLRYFDTAVGLDRFRRHQELLTFASMWVVGHVLSADRLLGRFMLQQEAVAA